MTTFKIVKLSSLSGHKFLVYRVIYFFVLSFVWLMGKTDKIEKNSKIDVFNMTLPVYIYMFLARHWSKPILV